MMLTIWGYKQQDMFIRCPFGNASVSNTHSGDNDKWRTGNRYVPVMDHECYFIAILILRSSCLPSLSNVLKLTKILNYQIEFFENYIA